MWVDVLIRSVVPLEGLEPPLPCEKQILSLPRLPFRHKGNSEQVYGSQPVAVDHGSALFERAV